MMKWLAFVLLSSVAGVVSGPSAAADPWPSKPIKIIVPFPPGGAADITSRHLQQPLSELLGQSVVIENKTGGGGIVGTEAMVRSAPDGHTIGMIVSTHAANVSLHQSLPFDSVKDIKPITVVTRSPNVLSVHPSESFKTLAELVAAAKAKPGQLILATSGNGTAQHFAAEHWKLTTGIDMVHVPYRGAGPALNDLVGGQVKIGLLNVASSLPHIQGGRLRPLAVTSLKRNPALPDVPTFSESIPDFDFAEWFALAAPRDTPDEIIEKIYAAVKKAASTPEFAAKVSAAGMVVDLQTPAEFRGFLVAQIAKLADLVKRANIKLD